MKFSLRLALFVAVAAMLLGAPFPAGAQSVSNQSGDNRTLLEMSVDAFLEGIPEAGSKAFFVKVNNLAPRARSLRLEVVDARGSNSKSNDKFVYEFSVPPTSTHGFSVYPQLIYNQWGMKFRFQLYEDGTLIWVDEKSTTEYLGNSYSYKHLNVVVLSSSNNEILWSIATPPPASRSGSAPPPKEFKFISEYGASVCLKTYANIDIMTFQITNPEILPSTWIGYLNVDMIVLNNFQMELLSPEQRQAILDWHRIGGTIIISPGPDRTWLSSSFLSKVLPEGFAASVETASITDEEFYYKSLGFAPALEVPAMMFRDPKLVVYAYKGNVIDIRIPTETVVSLSVQHAEEAFCMPLVFPSAPNVIFVPFDMGAKFFIGTRNLSEYYLTLIRNSPLFYPHSVLEMPFQRQMSEAVAFSLSNELRFKPAIGFILILVVVYIAVVCPLNFYYMKRKGMHRFIILTVPAIALVFCLGAIVLNVLIYGIDHKISSCTLSYETPDRKGIFNMHFVQFQASSSSEFRFKPDGRKYFYLMDKSMGDGIGLGNRYSGSDSNIRYSNSARSVSSMQDDNAWSMEDISVSSRETIMLLGFSLDENPDYGKGWAGYTMSFDPLSVNINNPRVTDVVIQNNTTDRLDASFFYSFNSSCYVPEFSVEAGANSGKLSIGDIPQGWLDSYGYRRECVTGLDTVLARSLNIVSLMSQLNTSASNALLVRRDDSSARLPITTDRVMLEKDHVRYLIQRCYEVGK